jgi:hypothetical protein
VAEPAVTVQAFHASDGSNLPVTRVVIHATCPPDVPYPTASAAGKARSTADYFTGEGSGGSAHYVMDVAGEEHCIGEDRIAWHAPPNQHSIGIEICGQASYTSEQWLSPDVLPAVQRAADRVADICQRYGLPVEWLSVADLEAGKKGITSHANVAAAWKQSDHTDPGDAFPADQFVAMVAAVAPVAGGTAPAAARPASKAAARPKASPTPAVDPVASVLRPGGGGYLFGRRGHVYAFGGAPYLGGWQDDPDPGDDSRTNCVALVPTLTGNGYWLVGADGAVYTYGDAPYTGGYRANDWGDSDILGAYPNDKIPGTGGLTLIRSIDLRLYDLPS